MKRKIIWIFFIICGVLYVAFIAFLTYIYLFWGYYIFRIHTTLPHEITLSLEEDHEKRQFLRQTPFCTDSRIHSIDHIILFRKNFKRIPARILSINGNEYTVLTTDGEKVIQRKQIIGVD